MNNMICAMQRRTGRAYTQIGLGVCLVLATAGLCRAQTPSTAPPLPAAKRSAFTPLVVTDEQTREIVAYLQTLSLGVLKQSTFVFEMHYDAAVPLPPTLVATIGNDTKPLVLDYRNKLLFLLPKSVK